MVQARVAMATIRLASETGSTNRSGRCWVSRAARAASTSAGRFGPRSGARIAAAERAASAAGSAMAGLRVFVVVAGDVVVDRLRHGLAGDLLPGCLQGWHAELAGEPGQGGWAGPGPRREGRAARRCSPCGGGRRVLLRW